MEGWKKGIQTSTSLHLLKVNVNYCLFEGGLPPASSGDFFLLGLSAGSLYLNWRLLRNALDFIPVSHSFICSFAQFLKKHKWMFFVFYFCENLLTSKIIPIPEISGFVISRKIIHILDYGFLDDWCDIEFFESRAFRGCRPGLRECRNVAECYRHLRRDIPNSSILRNFGKYSEFICVVFEKYEGKVGAQFFFGISLPSFCQATIVVLKRK